MASLVGSLSWWWGWPALSGEQTDEFHRSLQMFPQTTRRKLFLESDQGYSWALIFLTNQLEHTWKNGLQGLKKVSLFMGNGMKFNSAIVLWSVYSVIKFNKKSASRMQKSTVICDGWVIVYYCFKQRQKSPVVVSSREKKIQGKQFAKHS